MATSSLGRLTLDLAVKLSEFTDGMSKAERETKRKTDAMNKSVNDFKENLIDGLSGTRVGSAFSSINGNLKSVGGVAGMAGLAVAGVGLAAVGSAAGLSKLAIQTAKADAEMAVLANRAGVGVENFQILSKASEQLGVSQDQLGSILADVQEKLGEFSATEAGGAKDFFEALQNNTSLTTDEIRELGRTMQGKDGVEAIQLMKDKLDELGATSQEQRFVFESFASDLGNLLPLFENGGELLSRYGDELREAGVIKTAEAIEQSKILNAQTKALHTRYDGLKQQLASQMMPTLNNLVNYFSKGSKKGNQFAGVIKLIGITAKGAASIIVGLASGISALVNSFMAVYDQFYNIGRTGRAFLEADGMLAKIDALSDGVGRAQTLAANSYDDIVNSVKNGYNSVKDIWTDTASDMDELSSAFYELGDTSVTAGDGLSYSTKQAEDNAKAAAKAAKANEKNTKSLKKQAEAQARLVGISGDTGVGNAHLHIQYRDKSRAVSQAHKDRFRYGGKPLSAYRKTSGYGPRNTGIKGASRYHRGEDYALPNGTEITTTVPVKDVKPWFDKKGGGWVSTVTFEDGVQIDFLHQNPAVKGVKRGASSNASSLSKAQGEAATLISREQEQAQKEAQREAERLAKERTRIIVSQMDKEERLRYEHEQRKAKITELFGADSKQALKEERRYEEELHELRMKDAKEFLRIQKQVASIRQTIKDGTYRAATMLNDVVARSTMSNDDYARYSLGAQEDAARQGANSTYAERASAIESVESMADRAALLEEAKAEHEAAMYAIDLEYAEKRKQLEREVTDSKIAMYQGATTSMLGMLQGFFGESKTLQRMAWAAEKGFTLARILIKEKEALMNAWSSAPFPYNLGAVTTTAMKTGALAAAADAITPKGFKSGGYTGNMGVNQAAGVVHGQEFVFDAPATKAIGVERLEQIRQGKGLGGDVNIYNYAPGVDASAVVNDDGSVDVKIEKAVKQSWNRLANPNSFESKQLSRNYNTSRNRA